MRQGGNTLDDNEVVKELLEENQKDLDLELKASAGEVAWKLTATKLAQQLFGADWEAKLEEMHPKDGKA